MKERVNCGDIISRRNTSKIKISTDSLLPWKDTDACVVETAPQTTQSRHQWGWSGQSIERRTLEDYVRGCHGGVNTRGRRIHRVGESNVHERRERKEGRARLRLVMGMERLRVGRDLLIPFKPASKK